MALAKMSLILGEVYGHGDNPNMISWIEAKARLEQQRAYPILADHQHRARRHSPSGTTRFRARVYQKRLASHSGWIVTELPKP